MVSTGELAPSIEMRLLLPKSEDGAGPSSGASSSSELSIRILLELRSPSRLVLDLERVMLEVRLAGSRRNLG